MYCIKCGVELEDSEKKCPLCGTVVYHPDIKQPNGERQYPLRETIPETVNRSGLLFVLTILFSMPFALTLICDWSINGALTWSGYAAGAILLAYVFAVLPIWFKSPNPIVFCSADFIACGLFVWYIEYSVSGTWFFPFALPVIAALAVIVITVVTLCRYVREGYLYIFGGASIAGGLYIVLLELLLNSAFGIRDNLIWSFYPLICLFLFGVMLIVIAMCKPLRDSLHKKFFI